MGVKGSIASVAGYFHSGYTLVNASDAWGVLFGVISGILALGLTASMIWLNVENIKYRKEERTALQFKNAKNENTDQDT